MALGKSCTCLELLGKNVYCKKSDSKESLGVIEELIIDFPKKRIAGLSIKSRTLPPGSIVEFSKIQEIDEKGVRLNDIEAGPGINRLKKIPRYKELNKLKIITREGRLVGELNNIETGIRDGGKINYIYASHVFASSHKSIKIEAADIFTTGEKLIIIENTPPDINNIFEEKTPEQGFISDKIRDTGKIPAAKQQQKSGRKNKMFADNQTDNKSVEKLAIRQLEHLIGTAAYTDVVTKNGVILLKAGQKVDRGVIEKAIKHGKAAELIKSTGNKNA